MARPRKDGLPSAQPTRIGKPRPTSTGSTYKVRAYGPTATNPHGRVSYRNPETDRPTSAVPAEGQSLDDLFDQIEGALDQNVALGATTKAASGETVVRNIRNLADLYIQQLRDDTLDLDYISGRESLLRKWVLPYVGDKLVIDWTAQDSSKLINRMRASSDVNSQQRVDDLRSTLSGLRKTAHLNTVTPSIERPVAPVRAIASAGLNPFNDDESSAGHIPFATH